MNKMWICNYTNENILENFFFFGLLNMEIFHKLTNSASGTLEHNLLQYKIKIAKTELQEEGAS